MNLMNLFNFKYFKENIKKSKGLLAFLFGVVPLLNILILVITLLTNEANNYLTFDNLSILTFLGLFIIPPALALTLIGFIFKRKSVDFVISKPISRAHIYSTNIIGGIILLVLFTFLNSLIFFLFNIFSPIIIPNLLILDYFIFWLISYIFVFTLSVLAISISGNFMTTLVVILLLICLIPFVKMTNIYNSNQNASSYLKCTSEECQIDGFICRSYNQTECEQNLRNNLYQIDISRTMSNAYVAPLLPLSNTIAYNFKSMIKMLLLSLAFIVISYYTFSKRKMENNETSFKNDKIHYLVKSLTLIPFSFIAYLLVRDSFLIGILVSAAIILIYSVIYDLCTRREIYKFLKSSLITLAFFSFFLGLFLIDGSNKRKLVVDAKDITKLTINGNININDNITITDQKTIYQIIKGHYNEDSSYINVGIEAKGQNYLMRIHVADSIYEELLAKKKENIVAHFDVKNFDYSPDLEVTKEVKKLVKEAYDNRKKVANPVTLIQIYDYKNHEYQKMDIYAGASKALDEYVLTLKNKEALNLMETDKPTFSIMASNFSDFEKYIFDFVINNNLEDFKKYLQNSNKVYTSETAEIHLNAPTDYKEVIIGDSNEFRKEFLKYVKNVEDLEEYQFYVDNFE